MGILKKAFKFKDDVAPNSCEMDGALLVMRIMLALFFVVHGYSKLFGEMGIDGFTGMLVGLGVPAAGMFALLVGVAEFFGGLAILLGILTRFSALWLTIITLYAWIAVKGFSFTGGADMDVLALGLTVGLLIAGPGAISVSGQMAKKAAAEPEVKETPEA